jgi:hypothetical protein
VIRKIGDLSSFCDHVIGKGMMKSFSNNMVRRRGDEKSLSTTWVGEEMMDLFLSTTWSGRKVQWLFRERGGWVDGFGEKSKA